MLNRGDRPCRSSRVLHAEVRGELVLFDPAEGTLHRLRDDAAAIWALLDGGTTIGQLARELADVAGRPVDETTEHLSTVIGTLRDVGVVEVARTGGIGT